MTHETMSRADTFAMSDHDLLVVAITKLDALSATFAEMRVALALKADAARVEKVEDRLEQFERKLYTLVGALAVIEIAMRWLVK